MFYRSGWLRCDVFIYRVFGFSFWAGVMWGVILLLYLILYSTLLLIYLPLLLFPSPSFYKRNTHLSLIIHLSLGNPIFSINIPIILYVSVLTYTYLYYPLLSYSILLIYLLFLLFPSSDLFSSSQSFLPPLLFLVPFHSIRVDTYIRLFILYYSIPIFFSAILPILLIFLPIPSILSFLYLSPIHSIRVGTYITLFIFWRFIPIFISEYLSMVSYIRLYS